MANQRADDEFQIHDPQVFDTKGGKVTKGTMAIRDLLANIQFPTRPAQPWSDEDGHRRWKESKQRGHVQWVCKCLNCSLEFIILTLRSEVEALETYRPTHGQYGGLCQDLTCPECGNKGSCVLLGYRREAGTICQFVAGRLDQGSSE